MPHICCVFFLFYTFCAMSLHSPLRLFNLCSFCALWWFLLDIVYTAPLALQPIFFHWLLRAHMGNFKLLTYAPIG